MKIDFYAIKDMIKAIQRTEYPDNEEWFYDVQTIDQFIELLEDLAEVEG